MKSSIILFSVFLLLENNITPAITGKTFNKGITFLKEKNKYFLDSTSQEENKIRKHLEDGKDILMQNLKDENIWQLENDDEINEVFKTEATQVNNLTIIGAELLGLVSSIGTDFLMDMLELRMRDLPQDIYKHLKEISWNRSEATNISELCIRDLMESWRTKVLYNLSTIKKSIIDHINKVFDFIQGNNPDVSDPEVWEDEQCLDVSINTLIESARNVPEMMTNGERRLQRMSMCITKRFSELIDGISTKVNDLFLSTKNKLQELAVAAKLDESRALFLNSKLKIEIMGDLVEKRSDIIIDSSAAVNNFLIFIWKRMDEIKN